MTKALFYEQGFTRQPSREWIVPSPHMSRNSVSPTSAIGPAILLYWACYTPLMCGRFTQHLSWEELHRLADLIGQPRNLAPRYNFAPTTQIEVIRLAQTGKELGPMRWRLVPLWWKSPLNASKIF